MKNAYGILLVIALIYIFLQNICKPAVKPDDTALKALIKAQQDTIAQYRAVRASDSMKINEAGQATADQVERVEAYQNALEAEQATVKRLTAKIQGAKLEPKDHTWVEVSPHYVAGCDSLTDHIVILNKKVDDSEEQGAELLRLMSYEVSIRDSALNNEREFNSKFQSQLNTCITQLSDKVNQKERVQVYAGIGMFGNQINPIGGGQVNVSLRARNKQIYEVTGAVVGNTWYAGLGTKFLITFKR